MTFEFSLKRKNIVRLIGLVLCLTVSQLWAADGQRSIPLGDSTIEVAFTPYADQMATTALAELLLEKLGYEVKATQATIGIAFAGVASGDVDVDFNAWLPTTHGAYYQRYRDKLLDLGILYGPTKLGWAIPDYIPKDVLNSIADLKKPKVKEKLNGIITGIGAGAGLTDLSRKKVFPTYGLSEAGYTLRSSSGPAMTAALARAIENHEWIVVLAWTPHWMWQRWDLRYLKDPKGAFPGGDYVHVIARQGFRKSFPRATAFIEGFHMSASDVEWIMNKADKLQARGVQDAYTVAAKKYMENHPELVAKWLQLEPRKVAGQGAQKG